MFAIGEVEFEARADGSVKVRRVLRGANVLFEAVFSRDEWLDATEAMDEEIVELRRGLRAKLIEPGAVMNDLAIAVEKARVAEEKAALEAGYEKARAEEADRVNKEADAAQALADAEATAAADRAQREATDAAVLKASRDLLGAVAQVVVDAVPELAPAPIEVAPSPTTGVIVPPAPDASYPSTPDTEPGE